MSASSRGPLHTILPSSMNASVSATFSAFCACSSTSRTAQPRVAQLDDRLHHRVGGERREAERRLVGDEHLRRVGERGRQAQHLLLAAGEQAGDLLAPFGRGSGTARSACWRSVGSRRSTVRFSSTVRPGKMPRASGTRSRPSRAPSERRRRAVMSRPSSSTVPSVGVDHAGGDRAERRLAGAVGAEQRDDRAAGELQVDAVEHLDVAVAGDDAVHREHRIGAAGDRARRSGGAARTPRRLRGRARVRARRRRGRRLRPRRCGPRRSLARFLRSLCWPTSERMPSGSCASWMAPSPDRIGTK